MAGGVLGTRASAPGLDAALAFIAFLFAGLGLVEMVLTTEPSRASAWLLILTPLLAWIYCAAGLLAWRRRPSNRLGLLLVIGAAAWLGAGLTGAHEPALVAAGLVLATSPLAVVVHLVHAFPSGELRGASRPIVAFGYVVALGMQVPLYLYADAPAPYDVLAVADRPGLVTLATWVQGTSGALVMVATTVVLVRRLRDVEPRRRRVLAPLLGYGVVAVLMVPFASHVLGPLLHLDDNGIDVTQMVALAGIPVAFVLVLLRGGFGRTGEVQELGAWLSSGPGARPALAQALAETLGDPTLELWFWVPGRERYVDGAGGVVGPLPSGGHRGLVEVELGGDRIGAIVYDATLLADPETVRGAGRVVALALERERLTAELLGTREVLRHTLTRVVESADQERRRIARDLHDGLQSRLVLLGVEAYEIETDPTASPSLSQAARRLRKGLDDGAGELRRLVHGVLPAALIERGLYAATEEFVAQLPIRTSVSFPSGGARLPAAIESAAYFVVTEALTNTLKHAYADEARVHMELRGGRLRIAVTDNGVGGASPETAGGLDGLADRVAALGGRVDVDSPPGGGTTLLMEVPCVSS
ncbi:putative signal transduction histidine kinase [Nostocoides japonicum T1-X7]|uniref:histidine kinase n=1 Tax=Nostocoides japonicum T1-X7 TaxID=1194083 RepID=A0A077LUU0_9MICO|nr:histidine kinase [Tetrasphaera japonica]CCH77366.1 putative signal transduction histidine kinase [Tetrasphaera japonica T1-X7]